jgi:hypothetical protein
MASKRQDKVLQRIMMGVFLGSVLCVFGLLWYLSGSRMGYRRAARRANRSESRFIVQNPSRQMFLNGTPGPFLGGTTYQLSGSSGSRLPQGFPRYFANLSTQTGDFIVSVRQVADFEQGLTLYENNPLRESRLPMTHASVSVQVMTASEDEIERVVDFAAEMQATDDTGVVHQSKEVSRLTPFRRGFARIVYFPPPSADAKRYTRLSGSVRVKTENGEKEIPFALTNIPLPKENHFFGLAAAALLPEQKGDREEGTGNRGVMYAEAARAVEKNFPPFVPESGPLQLPNRLILISEQPNRFPLHLPTGRGEKPLFCTLTPHLGMDGKVMLHCRLETPNRTTPLEWDVSTWDNEPLVLLFDAAHFYPDVKGKAGLRLHLFSRPWMETLPSASPIPASKAVHSGTIRMRALVKNQPLRFGQARIELKLMNGSKGDQGETTVELNEQGEGRIQNVPPGTYSITLKELLPFRGNMTPVSKDSERLRLRYGLTNPQISARLQENLALRPGGQLSLKTWNVIDKAKPISLTQTKSDL